MKTYAKTTILLLLIATRLSAQSPQQIPPLENQVTDLAGLLSLDQRQALAKELSEFEQRKGSQIAVLTVLTTEPETIEQYAIRVVDKWQLGRKDVDDGVLLVIAKDDRKMRIEVGYGLEGAIPDIYAKRIINQVIVPRFRSGDYYHGIEEGIEAIVALVDGEVLAEVSGERSRTERETRSSPLLFLWILVMVISTVVTKALLRGKKRSLLRNLILIPLFFLVAWLFFSLGAAILSSVLAFTFLNGNGRHSRTGGYYGGYHGGSSSSHGGWGGGGFSGGGGGFGGGGASGSW